jgi:hypothetical protein
MLGRTRRRRSRWVGIVNTIYTRTVRVAMQLLSLSQSYNAAFPPKQRIVTIKNKKKRQRYAN